MIPASPGVQAGDVVLLAPAEHGAQLGAEHGSWLKSGAKLLYCTFIILYYHYTILLYD